DLAINTLICLGIDVVDLGLSTTPTVEVMVAKLDANGGIIFTASHNPGQWNALKFLNNKGEFISARDGKAILDMIDQGGIKFAAINALGKRDTFENSFDLHIEEILDLPYVDVKAIQAAQIKVVVDCINSTGALSIPPLLDKLGIAYTLINEQPNGHFAHNPEPLAEHLTQLSQYVLDHGADMGIAVDPDVDRLAFMMEDGNLFGEEYTLVAVADYILSKKGGNTVSNLSSTRALADITTQYGFEYYAAAVGEVNVVEKMKEVHAVIGGEGNGGIILPELHFGRDALVGIAIFLTYFAKKGLKMSALKAGLPQYFMIKDKIDAKSIDIKMAFEKLKKHFANERLNTIDGLKIDFENGWVHLRTSNTEPIIRIYAEAKTEEEVNILIEQVKTCII
ncbi:MAG TPA: phosphoglucosamine mutase, partial [Saprospiraceae bacterium]|nr:phosphoglucosamine mutase [Saprospiraceae bacterium]